MGTVYSTTAIDDRLLGVTTAVGQGFLKIQASGATVCTIALQNPCGTVSSGILTFTGTLLDPAAAGSALPVDGAIITDASGATMISGLTVGSTLGGVTPDLIISSSIIHAGDVVSLLSATITGA
jgi:hypothetical protein